MAIAFHATIPSVHLPAEVAPATRSQKLAWLTPRLTTAVSDLVVFAVIGTAAGSVAESAGLGPILGALPVLAVALATSGLYDPLRFHPAEELRVAASASTVALIAYGCALAFLPAPPLALAPLMGLGAFAVGAIVGGRALHRVLVGRTSWWQSPTVVLGSGTAGDDLVRTLDTWPEIGFRPESILRFGSDAEWRSATHEALRIGASGRATTLIVAACGLPSRPLLEFVRRGSRFYQRVLVVPGMPDGSVAWTTRREVRGMFGYGIRNAAQERASRMVKRAVDMAGALVALVLLAPVMVAVAIAVRLTSPGPVLYRQIRMRRNGRCFRVLKFRTMYRDAEYRLAVLLEADAERRAEYERFHKLRNDPRITSIGDFLRRHSLDELPQLFNVLRGEMSLVGPRAYMPGELDDMNGLARVVLEARPGMTGLWQVSGRNRLTFDERVRLDAHYVQAWSPWLDLYLLARTVPVVLTGEGAS